MFEKVCAAVTASSTFIIAALCVWWTANIVKCGNELEREVSKAQKGVTSDSEMEQLRLRIERQLESKRSSVDLPSLPPPPKHTLPSGAPLDLNKDLLKQFQEDADRTQRKNDKGFPGHYDKR